MSTSPYERPIDLTVDNAHTRVIRLVGEGRRVLELGCASGYMAKVLIEKFGCTVVGIERDPQAGEEARKVCSHVIVADIDTLDLAGALGDARFDVIVCADVLEHLRDPARILHALRPLLAPGGFLVASIPNVGHVAVIAELIEGRFPYRAVGLLDATHLRFFTRHSIYETFERAGFAVAHLERLEVEPGSTEFRTDLSRFPDEFVRRLRSHEDSLTYQFVVRATPAPAGATLEAIADAIAEGAPRPQPTLRDASDATRGLLDAFLGRMRFLEAERDRQARELADAHHLAELLRREIDARLHQIRALEVERARDEAEHQEQQARHQAEVARLGERLERLETVEQDAAALRERLVTIESSRLWRLRGLLRGE